VFSSARRTKRLTFYDSKVEALVKESGQVDILVNNGGIQYVSTVEKFPTERWDAIIAINLSAAFHSTKLALPGKHQLIFLLTRIAYKNNLKE